jgi:HEAT repeats
MLPTNLKRTNLSRWTASVWTTCVLLAPLPLLLTAVAHGKQVPETTTHTERDESARSLRRILYLRGGSSLRGVARATEDGWEMKRGGKWARFPQAAVERVELEKNVLKQWKSRWKKARKDLDARAALGAWSLDNGLLEEGLGTLERVFGDHPDQPQAREALARNAYKFSVPRVDPRAEDVPAATAELRRWAAGRGATSREMAILELARVRDREGLQKTLTADLFEGSFRKRLFSAHAMRRLFPGQAVEPLLQRAVLDGSQDVREQASYALRDTGKVGVIVPVAKALGSGYPKVRIQAAEALGNMGFGAAVEPLMMRLAAAQNAPKHNVPHSNIFIGRQFAYIQDFDVEVAQFQAVADPQINVLLEGGVLDAGVHGVNEVHFASEGRAIRNSLQKLTGADPGNSSRSWLRWWEKNGDKWRAAKLADTPPGYPASK